MSDRMAYVGHSWERPEKCFEVAIYLCDRYLAILLSIYGRTDDMRYVSIAQQHGFLITSSFWRSIPYE